MKNIETISILSAVALFFIKEFLDTIKRIRTRRRKILALKDIFTVELHRNFGVYLFLREAINILRDEESAKTIKTIKVSEVSENKVDFNFEFKGDREAHAISISQFSDERYEQHALVVAELDHKFHYLLKCTYAWTRYLRTKRNKLIHEIERLNGSPPTSLVDTAKEALEVAEMFCEVYKPLYAYCTHGSMPGTFTVE